MIRNRLLNTLMFFILVVGNSFIFPEFSRFEVYAISLLVIIFTNTGKILDNQG